MNKILLVLMLFSPLAFAEKLTVVADEWPPFSGENLPNKGLTSDLVRTALESAGYEVDVQVLPWARIMNGAKNGSYDVVGSLFYTEELLEFMEYGDAYYKTDIKVLKRNDYDFSYKGMESLLGHKVAVGDGFLYFPEFDRSSNIDKVKTTTTAECIQMVSYKRANLTLDSEEVLQYTLGQLSPNITNSLNVMSDVLYTQSMFMAVSKKTKNYKKILRDYNKSLQKMKLDGRYDNIVQYHLKYIEND